MVHSESLSDLESMGDNEYSFPEYPFDDYDLQHVAYLEHFVILYIEHMYYYELGIVGGKDFLPTTMVDVYNENRYCMSWFYSDCNASDQWETDYDNWLYEQVCSVMMRRESNICN